MTALVKGVVKDWHPNGHLRTKAQYRTVGLFNKTRAVYSNCIQQQWERTLVDHGEYTTETEWRPIPHEDRDDDTI